MLDGLTLRKTSLSKGFLPLMWFLGAKTGFVVVEGMASFCNGTK